MLKQRIGFYAALSTAVTFFLIAPMQADEPARTVVIYLEGQSISAGFAGESEARIRMPAAVATIGGGGPMIGMQRNRTVYGDEAVQSGGAGLSYAVQSGRIVDYDAFEKLLQHILYQKLSVDPTEIALVMNESASGSSAEREQTTQLMFETFDVPYFFMSPHFQSFGQISQMASESTFYETLITKDEYDERGPAIIHIKSGD
ncbi:MAG: hypothetical protein KDK34_13820 [Leptospiraceae bacterium]|nr:hypothetical protein [Leptospiraceae bacterium]